MMISFVIPIYNRPEELGELLASFLRLQAPGDALSYEIIIVEDGSEIPSREVVEKYRPTLPVTYLTQSNTGPSGARNHGASAARGEWFLFLDSDTILPEGYLRALLPPVSDPSIGLFGGPDREHPDFTPIQKGISYSMTALLTTGGIRGGKGSVDRFYPRSFNMGIRRELFRQLGGFDLSMRYGEDLDLSMRAIERGAESRLASDAWLYHKRRTDFKAFFRQVSHSGEARWALERKHPGTMKVVHWFPAAFTVFFALAFIRPYSQAFFLLYALCILLDALVGYRYTFVESVNAVVASFVQHIGYGHGFLKGLFRR